MQQTLTPHRNTRLLALVAATAIALAGCGSDGDGGGGGGSGTAGGGGGGGETTQLVQMFASDFEPACRNNPVEGATPYTPATPGIHKVVTQQGTAADYGAKFETMTDEARAQLHTAANLANSASAYADAARAIAQSVKLAAKARTYGDITQ